MAKYFTSNNRLVIYYLPESSKPGTTGSNSRGDRPGLANGGQGK